MLQRRRFSGGAFRCVPRGIGPVRSAGQARSAPRSSSSVRRT